jgi:hypothetical protein
MLVLLSAPRGRVSAARVAARAREHERAEAQRTVVRVPRVAAAVTPGGDPRKPRAASVDGGRPRS